MILIELKTIEDTNDACECTQYDYDDNDDGADDDDIYLLTVTKVTKCIQMFYK